MRHVAVRSTRLQIEITLACVTWQSGARGCKRRLHWHASCGSPDHEAANGDYICMRHVAVRSMRLQMEITLACVRWQYGARSCKWRLHWHASCGRPEHEAANGNYIGMRHVAVRSTRLQVEITLACVMWQSSVWDYITLRHVVVRSMRLQMGLGNFFCQKWLLRKSL
jgi:hypothetical protein